ncbi:hypothetical protein [Corynebacterium aquilae]|uniref:hypothetical protein n=1 Tax=Corynebacterium aquilae TaxID=203263 RepID=UPI0012ED19D6|nr:hypothetical protein [Corynebacterium aquilae]
MDINAVVGSLGDFYQGLSSAPACDAQGQVCPAGGFVFRGLLALLPLMLPVALSSVLFG